MNKNMGSNESVRWQIIHKNPHLKNLDSRKAKRGIVVLSWLSSKFGRALCHNTREKKVKSRAERKRERESSDEDAVARLVHIDQNTLRQL